MDGTEFLRIPIGTYRVSFNDAFLILVLYFDLLDGFAKGFHLPRFLRVVAALTVALTALSSVSLLYVPEVGLAYDLKITLNFVELFLVAWLSARTVTDESVLSRALLAFLAGTSIVAVATLLKSAGFDIPGFVRETARFRIGPFLVGVIGLVGRGLSFELALLGALPTVVFGSVIRRGAVRLPLFLLLVFAGIITYSRSLWLAILSEIVAALAWKSAVEKRLWRRLAAGGALAAGAVYLVFEGADLYRALVELRQQTVTSRLAGFAHALRLATDDPVAFLFGAGKGFFVSTFVFAGVPHNFLLDLLVSKGILVMLTFVSLLAIVGTRLFLIVFRPRGESDRKLGDWSLILLTALLGSITQGLFAPITTSMNFLAVISLGAAVVGIADDRRRQAPA